MKKSELEFELNRMGRRVGFRSESRVESSLFFHVLYSTLIEMNRSSEEFLEELLRKGSVSFDHFDEKGKVRISIQYQSKVAENDDKPEAE